MEKNIFLNFQLKWNKNLFLYQQPENSVFQAFIYDIIQHLYFKRFIAILVLVNSFLLSVKWEPEEDDDTDKSKMIDGEDEGKKGNKNCMSFVFWYIFTFVSQFHHKINESLSHKQRISGSRNKGGLFDDYNPAWTMATASSALTICFVIEVIMKMIAFTPYGKNLMHVRYNYENIFSDLNTKDEIELCLSFPFF